MPKRKKVFSKPRLISKKKKDTRQYETEYEREERLSNNRERMKRSRESQTEEERAYTNDETRSRVKSIRNRQSVVQREVEKISSKERMANLRQQRAATCKLEAFHYDCKKQYSEHPDNYGHRKNEYVTGNMENDDDTFILVIGDDVDRKPHITTKIIAWELDTETESSYVTEPLKQVNPTILKKEDIEHLTTEEGQAHSKEIRTKEEFPAYDGSDQDHLAKRVRMCKPKERQSYVQTMRKIYPELRKDDELLVKRLATLMKETQPPPLPEHYYDLDGIMLQCVYCKAKSKSLPAASRHYREKHGVRYLLCLACGVNFRSTTNLYKHEKKCDSPDAGLVLRARAAYLGRKGRARPFLCKDKNTKPPPKRLHCQLCSASFTTKDGLTAHSLMHEGKRPYICQVCGRAYTSNTVLSKHTKKHAASSRFECDHCQSCFNHKPALIAHLDTHKPLKRFACKECDARYSQRAGLLLHFNREHRGLPPPCACQLCSKRYPRMSLLKEHMRKVHGMSIMTRKMFYRELPTLTLTNMEHQHAKVVTKSKLIESAYYSVENGDSLGIC